jgi:hypothetical protein
LNSYLVNDIAFKMNFNIPLHNRLQYDQNGPFGNHSKAQRNVLIWMTFYTVGGHATRKSKLDDEQEQEQQEQQEQQSKMKTITSTTYSRVKIMKAYFNRKVAKLFCR